MKKVSLYISALMLGALGLSSCADNWETPPMDVPTEGADVQATLTIAELKALYWQDTESYGTPVTALPDGQHAIIKGTIVSSTESGNIYKAVYVQDSTAAICIGVDTASVSAVLPMGVGVAIDVTGLQIGRYSGAMQLGKADGSSVNRITYKELKPHVALDYFGGKLDTTVVTLEQLARPSQQDIREWGGKLVRINGVRFQEAGQDFAEGTNTSRHITDSLGNNSIIVYDSPYADFAYDTMPYGIGDVVGILSNYRTQWQLLLIDKDGVIGFTGEGAPDENAEEPEWPAEFKDALTVAEALDIISSGNIPTEAVQVKGRITAIDNVDPGYGNATYTIMDLGGRKGLIVYRGYWLNGDKFTSEDQLKIGEWLVVEGKLVNYNGSTPEITTGSKILWYTGDDTSGNNPGTTPDAPTGVISVAEALNLIANGYEGNAQVKGIISSIDEIDTGSYGNATYYITDENLAQYVLEIFRGYWFDGAKFTSANQLEVGAEVIVEGKLVNYNGTYEMTTGSKIISYNGQTTAPDTPGSGDNGDDNQGGDTPANPGDEVVLENWTSVDWTGGADGWEGVVNGYTLKIEKGNSTSSMENAKPNKYSFRVYKNGYFTLTAPAGVKFAKVIFTLDDMTTAYTASVPSGWTATTGSKDNLEFTVSSTSAANSLKLTASDGQIRVSKLTVVTAE